MEQSEANLKDLKSIKSTLDGLIIIGVLEILLGFSISATFSGAASSTLVLVGSTLTALPMLFLAIKLKQELNINLARCLNYFLIAQLVINIVFFLQRTAFTNGLGSTIPLMSVIVVWFGYQLDKSVTRIKGTSEFRLSKMITILLISISAQILGYILLASISK